MPRLKNHKLYCSVCLLYVRNNQKGILCDICEVWHHARCVDINQFDYDRLSNSDEHWYCITCLNSIFPFSDLSDEDFALSVLPAASLSFLRLKNVASFRQILVHFLGFS
jgi:hypothetical protein